MTRGHADDSFDVSTARHNNVRPPNHDHGYNKFNSTTPPATIPTRQAKCSFQFNILQLQFDMFVLLFRPLPSTCSGAWSRHHVGRHT
jgi:hypothetical protein